MSRRMILCLGPHRTGTSLLAAGLGALGAELRLGAVYANEDNAKGFFEQPEVVAFNDRLLAALGGAWDAVSFEGTAAIAAAGPEAMAPWRAEAGALAARLFGDVDLAALKDPRLSLLLPFWREALGAAGFGAGGFGAAGFGAGDLLFVHVLRDPVEAALSQRARCRRDTAFYEIGRELPEGAALWLSYTAQAMAAIAAAGDGPVHLMIDHAGLMADPAGTLGRIAAFAGLSPDPERIAAFAGGFVDEALHRSHAEAAARAEIEAALPGLAAIEAGLRALVGAGPFGAAEAAPLAAACAAAPLRHALRDIAAGTSGRLSHRLRLAGAELARLGDLEAEAQTARAATEAQIPPLREGLAQAQEALAGVIAERAALVAEVARLEALIQARARRGTGFLRRLF